MPNHTTTIIRLIGKQADVNRVKRLYSFDEDENHSGDEFPDLNKIIPMPESLRITSGSSVDTGIAILKSQRGDHSDIDKMLEYTWVKNEGITTREKLIEHLLETDRGSLGEAAIALDNLQKYGFKDWYDWSYANWGTKWNTYSHMEEDLNCYQFQTAWACPLPALEEMARKHPEVEFHILSADEDMSYGCFEAKVKGDDFWVKEYEGGSKEAYDFYFKVCGGEELFVLVDGEYIWKEDYEGDQE